MKTNSESTVTISFNGELVLNRETLLTLLRNAVSESVGVVSKAEAQTACLSLPPEERLPRMAYTTRETAEILGVSHATVYRLIIRGLLRSSLATRTKLIARSEIERFLKETSKSLWSP